MYLVEKKAFLDILLDLSETGDKPLSVADIREEVDTFMFEVRLADLKILSKQYEKWNEQFNFLFFSEKE